MKSLLANAAAIACLTAAISKTLYKMDDVTPPSVRPSPLRSNDVRTDTAHPSSERMTQVEKAVSSRTHDSSAARPADGFPPAGPLLVRALSTSGVAVVSRDAAADENATEEDPDQGIGYGLETDSDSSSSEASPRAMHALRKSQPPQPVSGPLAGTSATATAPPPKPAIATVLLEQLPAEIFNSLTAHEQLAITELGTYAKESVENPEITPQTPDENPALEEAPSARAARIWSETDAYLRATLGFARFNQLSALASGLVSSTSPVPTH